MKKLALLLTINEIVPTSGIDALTCNVLTHAAQRDRDEKISLVDPASRLARLFY